MRLILSCVFLFVFLIDLVLMKAGYTEGIDEAAGAFARSLRGPVQNEIVLFLTNLASWKYIVGIIAVIVIIDIFVWRKANIPIALGTALLTLGVYGIIKAIIKRPRPDEALWLLTEHGYSFPSGHTMNGTFCYGMMLYLVIRNVENKALRYILTAVLSFYILIIGFTRMFVGVHYLTDVVAGFSLGFSFLMIATIFVDEIMLRAEMRSQAS